MKRELTIAELYAGSDFLVKYMQECKRLHDIVRKSELRLPDTLESLKRKETQADFLLGEINITLFKAQSEKSLEEREDPDQFFIENFINELKLALGTSPDNKKITLYALA